MKKFKKILSLTLCIFSLFSLLGCTKEGEVRDDLTCAELMRLAEAEIPTDMGYEDFSAEHLRQNFASVHNDHALRYSVASDNMNETGILHAPDKKAARELYNSAQKYLDDLLAEKGVFASSYAPKEYDKLKNAEVRLIGNYVAYAVLSKDDRQVFFDTLEKAIEK